MNAAASRMQSDGVRRALSTVAGWALLCVLIVGAWAIFVNVSHISPLIVPPPKAVFEDVISNRDVYITAASQTAFTAFSGLLFGTLIAYVLAILAWWSAALSGASRPVIYFLQAVPMTGLIPVISGAMGYGYPALITITTLGAFFPTYVVLTTAMANLPAGSTMMLTAAGATRLDLLRYVAIPSSVPSLFIGLQLSSALCITGSFAAEYLYGSTGLGGTFGLVRSDYTNTAMPWGIAIVATMLAAVTYGICTVLVHRVNRRIL